MSNGIQFSKKDLEEKTEMVGAKITKIEKMYLDEWAKGKKTTPSQIIRELIGQEIVRKLR